MADSKDLSYEESRKKDKAERKKDYIICVLGFALAFLAKAVA